MFACVLAILWLATSASGDGAPPDAGAPASAPAPSPEDVLWQQVLALQAETPTTQPQAAWFESARRQRQAIVEKLRLYLTLYPGGTHRVEAVRLELATLYELCSLDGGDLTRLCARAEEHLHAGGADDPVVWEAAYWQILCRRVARVTASTQPTTQPVLTLDEELLAACWQHVTTYPRSPSVPHMAEVLFEDALKRDDEARVRRLLQLLSDGFPDHATTAALTARWKRHNAVGSPFWLVFEQPDGGPVDTREAIGRPVLIVVWESTDADARRCVSRVELFRGAHDRLDVVGVNLDVSREAMTVACAELGVTWPQFNDGLGPANRFAREWGVRRVPCVFVVDAHGRLAGCAHDDSWEQLALTALAGQDR